VSKGSPNDKEQSAGCSRVIGTEDNANAAVRLLVAGTLIVCMFAIINHLTSQVAYSLLPQCALTSQCPLTAKKEEEAKT